MNKILLSFILFFLSSCSYLYEMRLDQGIRLAETAAQTVEKEYRMTRFCDRFRLHGSECYEMVGYGFRKIVEEKQTIESARPIIVGVTKKFVSIINAHPEVAENFSVFPLPTENVKITISLTVREDDYDRMDEPYVQGVGIEGNQIYYLSYARELREGEEEPQIDIFFETLEEAEAILEAEARRSSISKALQ